MGLTQYSNAVGLRVGAVLRRRGLSVSPRFLWECLTSRTVSPFPAPATTKADLADIESLYG